MRSGENELEGREGKETFTQSGPRRGTGLHAACSSYPCVLWWIPDGLTGGEGEEAEPQKGQGAGPSGRSAHCGSALHSTQSPPKVCVSATLGSSGEVTKAGK